MKKVFFAALIVFGLTARLFFADNSDIRAKVATTPASNGMLFAGESAKSNLANVITVAKSGGDYDTIQAAVEAATSGTTVFVLPGEYAEQVFITKAISLIGTDKNNCVIKKSVAGNGGGGAHLVSVKTGIASGYVKIKNLTMWNTYSAYSSTALMIESSARVSNCILIGNHADTLYLRRNCNIYVDRCQISGLYDVVSIDGINHSLEYKISNSTIVSTGSSGANSMPVWIGNNNSNAHINDCDLITHGTTGAAGILVASDSGKTIKMYLTNVRCFKPDYTVVPLFYSNSNGTGTTAYISNCQYSTLGNSNVTAHYLKTSGADMNGNLNVSGALASADSKFAVNSDGNITKINNVATSFPSSQGAAGAFLKNDGNGNLSWASADGGSSKPANVITVAKSGGDYDTIQAAVEAATTGTTVLVLPGEYAEQVFITKAISLIGTDKNNCVVKKDVVGDGWGGSHLITIEAGIIGVVEIRNLTAYNPRTSYSGTSLIIKSDAKIRNCDLVSDSWDTVIVGLSTVHFDDCLISGRCDTLSIMGYGKGTTVYVDNCRIEARSTSTSIWTGGGDSGGVVTVYLNDCELLGESSNPDYGRIDVRLDTLIKLKYYITNTRCFRISDRALFPLFFPTEFGANMTAYIANCQYSSLGNSNVIVVYPKSSAINADGDSAFSGEVKAGSLKIGGDSSFGGEDAQRTVTFNGYNDNNCVWNTGDEFTLSGWTFGGDTTLYRPSANTLKTDGVFDANQFYASSVLWKDWAAAAGSGAFVYDAQSKAMTTTVNGTLQFFSIPYERGTVLTRLRVKWQAQGAGDGIKVRLIKRDESGTESAWTLVGAQQTYTDAEEPYDVAVSVYDFDDETMAANHSYTIEVESAVVSAGVKLFAVGLEMSKRVI